MSNKQEKEGMTSHLVLLPNKALEDAKNELTMLQVYHPRQDSTLVFMQEGKFFEIQKAQIAKYSSWFIGQRVLPNKDILMSTPYDPRFILLPYFETAGSRFSPLDQIVHTSTIPTPVNIKIPPLHHWRNWNMDEVFDVNDQLGEDMIVFRFNKEKTISWLRNKVEKVARVLALQRKRAQQHAQPSFAASFRSGNAVAKKPPIEVENEAVVNETDRHSAIEIVCDYISDSLISDLISSFGISVDAVMVTKANLSGVKRKADWELALEQEQEEMAQSTLLKGSSSGNGNKIDSGLTVEGTVATNYSIYLKGENPINSQPVAKVTKTMTLNAAAAKGTKTIASFFGAKK